VNCWLPCEQSAECDANYEDWPYDQHKCEIAFRTFLTYENVLFNPDEVGGSLKQDMNNEWRLLDVTAVVNTFNATFVKFTFKLQRFSDIFFKHVKVPGYCLIIFSLMILWIDHENQIRLIFSGLNIYLHFSLLDRVWWQ
jgi:hypothetical protein